MGLKPVDLTAFPCQKVLVRQRSSHMFADRFLKTGIFIPGTNHNMPARREDSFKVYVEFFKLLELTENSSLQNAQKDFEI